MSRAHCQGPGDGQCGPIMTWAQDRLHRPFGHRNLFTGASPSDRVWVECHIWIVARDVLQLIRTIITTYHHHLNIILFTKLPRITSKWLCHPQFTKHKVTILRNKGGWLVYVIAHKTIASENLSLPTIESFKTSTLLLFICLSVCSLAQTLFWCRVGTLKVKYIYPYSITE